jgi:thiamine-phosphate diphosphorylase
MYLGGLCFITDHRLSDLTCQDIVITALKAGARWIQLRDKEGSRHKVYEESISLRNITKDFQSVLIINDHPDIALAVNADGVHLGQDDLPAKEARKIMGKDALIGVSTHTVEQAIAAEGDSADYVGFGPVFHTSTKNAGSPRGIDMLHEIKSRVHIPVVAIGGISPGNARSVFEAGADAVAVASAILTGDVDENTKKFLEIVQLYH